MAHRIMACGVETGPIFAEVIGVGARHHLTRRVALDRTVEVGLAEETTVRGIGPIARVFELTGLDHLQPPAEIDGQPFDPAVASPGTAAETA